MLPTRDLQARLRRLPLVSFTEYAYRIISDKYRNTPLSALGPYEHGGRQDRPTPPQLILTVRCVLSQVLDLRNPDVAAALGTSRGELVAKQPSRHVWNARGRITATQRLGQTCFESRRIAAMMAPSAADPEGDCLNVFSERLLKAESVQIVERGLTT